MGRAFKSPQMVKWMDENGVVPIGSTPGGLAELVKSTIEGFRKLVEAIGIKPE